MADKAGLTVRPGRLHQTRQSGIRKNTLMTQRVEEHKTRLREKIKQLDAVLKKNVKIRQSNGVSLVTPVFALKAHMDKEKADRVGNALRVLDEAKLILKNSTSPFEISTWITLCEKTSLIMSNDMLAASVWNTPKI